ncbi:MAG TPA: PPOX class F420-dependent oxidoreductase [Gaiellaceae bacterium]
MRLPDEVRSLCEGANYAHLATLLPDGAPVSIPIWAGVEDGRIVFFTQPESRKAAQLARDPRLALSVLDHDNPYRSARVRGHVAETIDGDEALAIIDRLSHKYTGQPFPMRSGRVYVIEAERASFTELPFRHEPG